MGYVTHTLRDAYERVIVRWLGRLPERLDTGFLEGNFQELGGESKRFGGQASKSIRWMPWHQEAMKDVVKLR